MRRSFFDGDSWTPRGEPLLFHLHHACTLHLEIAIKASIQTQENLGQVLGFFLGILKKIFYYWKSARWTNTWLHSKNLIKKIFGPGKLYPGLSQQHYQLHRSFFAPRGLLTWRFSTSGQFLCIIWCCSNIGVLWLLRLFSEAVIPAALQLAGQIGSPGGCGEYWRRARPSIILY